jgi:hypothetical protein
MKNRIQSPSEIKAFPERTICECVAAWWNGEIDKCKDDPFAPKGRTDTLYEVLPVIDSLAVLESMIVIEQVLDQKVPAKFIKAGGYDSADEMLKHLLPQLRTLHENKHIH